MELNYSVLKERNPLLHELLITVVPSLDINVTKSKDAYDILELNDFNQKNLYLNSKYSVSDDIEDYLSTSDKEAGLIFQVGFNAGHEIKAFINHKSNSTKMVIVEPNIEIFKKVMDSMDIHEIISHKDIYICAGDFNQIKSQFLFYSNYLYVYSSSKLDFKILNYSSKLNEKNNLIQILKEFKSTIVSRATLIGNSMEDTLLGINHLFSNILNAYESINIRELRNTYKGKPAVCVASGPSLDKNVDLLKDVQDKALIFCADSAYEKLINKGIISDATSVMERPKVIYDLFFENKQQIYHDDTCLLSQIVAYPKIFSEYKGKKIVCSKEQLPFEKNISDKVSVINNYYNGLSCAHLSVATAILLGCNPIILLGQDLAYGTDGYSHAKGTVHEKNKINDSNNLLMEVLSYDKKETVKTSVVWDTFRRWFEEVFSLHNNYTFINATEGGAYINGALNLPFEEVIEKYLKNQENKTKLVDAHIEMEIADKNNMLNDLKIYLNNEISEVKRIINKLNKIEKKIKKIHNLKDQNITANESKKLIKFVNELEDCFTFNENIAFITQSLQVLFRQNVHKYSNIKSKEEFVEFTNVILNRTIELKSTLNKVLYEYSRGEEILINDRVDSIETNLCGESVL